MNDPDIQGGDARKVLQVESDAGGMRLDQWLAKATAPELSRSRIQALIRDGAVRVGGAVALEARAKVAPGDVVEVDVPPPQVAAPEAEAIPLDILFEDNQLVVVNKPAGMVVHPGAGNWNGTLVNALIAHCGETLSGIGGVRRPGIVHRLDRNTSGVLVVAKTDHAHRELAAAFADHGRSGELERAYEALVWGAPPRAAGTIDATLGRSNRDRTRQAVVSETQPDARHAVTHYAVRERFGEKADVRALASLVECRLETGRTHQIRVHMAHIGHPLIGDREYGSAFLTKANALREPVRTVALGFRRQALHARLLAFRHPTTHIRLRFEAPMPEDMAQLLAAFRAVGQAPDMHSPTT
ncbi:MAG: RluA family pseudouridine synthase [Rhizobiaceae bacterium]